MPIYSDKYGTSYLSTYEAKNIIKKGDLGKKYKITTKNTALFSTFTLFIFIFSLVPIFCLGEFIFSHRVSIFINRNNILILSVLPISLLILIVFLFTSAPRLSSLENDISISKSFSSIVFDMAYCFCFFVLALCPLALYVDATIYEPIRYEADDHVVSIAVFVFLFIVFLYRLYVLIKAIRIYTGNI